VTSSAAEFDGLVIFGALDPAAESHFGSGRLFATDVKTGSLVWASDVVAHMSACTPRSTSELHESFAQRSSATPAPVCRRNVANTSQQLRQTGDM
jgi:hypothetical protein